MENDAETITEGKAIDGGLEVVYDDEAKTYTLSYSYEEGAYFTEGSQYAVVDEDDFFITFYQGVGPTEETTVCSQSLKIIATYESKGEDDQWIYKLTINDAENSISSVFSVEGDNLSIYFGSTTPIVLTRVTEE